jgi:predicted anti-sigma-YlaC factor YlaD
MIKKSCEDIQKILVDYADGQLCPEEETIVSQHLKKCQSCRKLFRALDKSLELSTIIWEDNLTEIDNVAIPASPKIRKIHWLKYASVAASILIIVTTAILWNSSNKQQEPEIQLSFEEIERNINDSANAARLLAATELLADYPDYKEMIENQYRYIARVYPGTPAAEKIKLKIQ